MNFDKKNKINTSPGSSFSRIEKLHPLTMMVYLGMLGIGVLFTILVIAYLQTKYLNTKEIALVFPLSFSLSTVFILFSSFTIQQTSRLYKKDNLVKLKKYYLYTLGLGVAFLITQLLGWRELAKTGAQFTGMATETYIYLISALHALHLLGGFVFLTVLYFKTQLAASDAIRTLIFIRNPFLKQQIKLLRQYWHFMGGLWLLIFLVFLFTMRP